MADECDIRIDLIDPHPKQPRLDFDPDAIARLAASMEDESVGLLQPIIIRPTKDGRYELLGGERRLRAARALGWPTIRASVRITDDATALRVLLLENLEREALNPLEEAYSLAELQRPADEGGAGLTVKQIAAQFHRSETWCTRKLSLLRLKEPWRGRLLSGEINESEAELVARANPDVQQALDVARNKNPSAFRTREQWRTNIRAITQQMNGKPAESEASEQEAETSSRPSEAKKQTRRTPPHLNTLTDSDISRLLKPHKDNRRDLVSIRTKCQLLIDQLDERQAG